jgi:hypothetical protein
VSYRRKVKNGDNHRKAKDNINASFADDFQHGPPPVVDQKEAFNWAFISTSSYEYHGDLFILLHRDCCNTVFRHGAQNHLLDADHNSDHRGRFRTDGCAGVTGYKERTNFFPHSTRKEKR